MTTAIATTDAPRVGKRKTLQEGRKPGSGRKPKAGVNMTETRAWRFTEAQVKLLDAVLQQKRLSDAREYFIENIIRDAEQLALSDTDLVAQVKTELMTAFGPDPRSRCAKCNRVGMLLRATKAQLRFRCEYGCGHVWSTDLKPR